MELAANVWPVVDSQSGVVQRFFIRAYAMDAADEIINRTLRVLAPHDFRLAKMFVIPQRFKLVTDHGTVTGCVTIGDFHEYQFQILEVGFNELEKDHAKFQGIALESPEMNMRWIDVIPRFPPNPYLVVTTLIEAPDGSLYPQISKLSTN